jgi:hypothetical protein
MKEKIKNDVVKNLKAEIKGRKVKISLKNRHGLGYDGCGSHTHQG